MADSFIFYRSFAEALGALDDSARLALYDGLCAYALLGQEPQLTGMAAAMFTLMRPQVDANARRREAGALGAAHGKKGGRPSKAKGARQDADAPSKGDADTPSKGDTEKNPNGVMENAPGKTPNENVNVNANGNGNGNANGNEDANGNVSPHPHTPSRGQVRADAFEQFFAAYPKQQAKEGARKAWERLQPDGAMAAAIMAGLAAQKGTQGWQREGGRYIPLAEKWLAGRRWEDIPQSTSALSPSIRAALARMDAANRALLEPGPGV